MRQRQATSHPSSPSQPRHKQQPSPALGPIHPSLLYAVPQDSPFRASSPMQPPGKLPKYMHRRGRFYYFKRKIPADLMHVFGDGRDQMWKALGTSLFEKAKVMLAVEVSEFDFAVAKHRRQLAAKSAGLPARVDAPKESVAPATVDINLTAEQQAHRALVRGIEESLQKLLAMMPGGQGLAGMNTDMTTTLTIAPLASARAKVQSPVKRAKLLPARYFCGAHRAGGLPMQRVAAESSSRPLLIQASRNGELSSRCCARKVLKWPELGSQSLWVRLIR